MAWCSYYDVDGCGDVGKWFGACNKLKSDLDDCFFQEKEVKRSENLRKAREFDAKFEEFLSKKKASSGPN